MRLPSPDGYSQFLVIRTNAGATTSFGYSMYVVPPGADEDERYKVGFAYGGRVYVKWLDSHTICVELKRRKYLKDVRPTIIVPVWPGEPRTIKILFRTIVE